MRLSQTAATGFLLAAVSFAGTAWAVPFTWTPTAASPSLNGAPINADNILITDFDSINTATGAFNGVLGITNFQSGGSTFVPTGYGSNYSLYLTFSGTSNPIAIPTAPNTSNSSAFTSLTYTLWANQGPLPSFAITPAGPTITGTSSPFALATGSLISGPGTLSTRGTQPISPTANVVVASPPLREKPASSPRHRLRRSLLILLATSARTRILSAYLMGSS